MAQPYAAYPPGGYYAPGSYDYNVYYHQQAYGQAYWAQQQQYSQQYGAAPQVQAPAPPQAPPLPADDPPPLPPDDADATTAGQGQAEGAKAAGEPTGAASGQAQLPASQIAPAGNTASAGAANASGSHYSAVSHAAQYPHYAASCAGGYYAPQGAYSAPPPPGYGAPQGYGAPPASYGHPSYGSYGPATNSSYASQVPQQSNAPYPPSAPHPGASSSPASAANTSGRVSKWNAVPPPASLTAGAAGANKPITIKLATLHGSSTAAAGASAAGTAAPRGSTPSVLDAGKLSAAIVAAKAAAAVAAQASGNASAQQQQFIAVGGSAAAARASEARKDLPPSFNQYVQRALLLAGGDSSKQNKLKNLLLGLITEHRKAGTMWSTDWDRKPLPELDSPSTGAAGRNSVFDRMSSPRGQQGGWDSRRRYRDYSDDEDSRGGGYKRDRGRYGNSPTRGRQVGYKRSWDDDSRHGSGSDSDDERSDSWDNDDKGYMGRAAAAAAGDKWGQHNNSSSKKQKKKQRLELQASGGGRGRGRGKKQQQEGGRGHGRGRGNNALSAADAARQAARSARFGAALQMAAYGWEDDGDGEDGGFIVGTCQTLEKRYLRLTRVPLPEEVRPQPVLAAALRRLLGMIASKADKYLYYNDQFKAMRQDLTVQGIQNDFTVQVYEAHARAALEYGDNAEYNQCQAQLAILYAKGLPGSHAEFGAYRLLYQSVYANHGEGRKLLGTLRQLLGNRVGQVASSPEVQHAMQVRQALASGNVLRFFRLYTSAPLLSRRLMDAAVKQLRYKVLCALVRTHKPTVIQLSFLTRSLGFVPPEQQQQEGSVGAAADLQQQLGALTVDGGGSLLPGCSEQRCIGEFAPCADEQQGMAACLEWCKKHGAVFDQERDLSTSVLLTKDCWNKLFVPVDTSKVAHGDANLDIRDFLATN